MVFTSNCSKPVFWAHLTSPCLPIYLIIYLSDYLTSWFDLIWPPHQTNRGRSITCQDTALRKHLPALNKPCFLLPSRRFKILLTPLLPSPAWTSLFHQPTATQSTFQMESWYVQNVEIKSWEAHDTGALSIFDCSLLSWTHCTVHFHWKSPAVRVVY